jgi:ABC-type lipoprotein release transport system permease subunit
MMGLRDQYRQPLRVLMAMVALVLLIACGNIAMLLAARNSARLREFSLRTALGGSTRRTAEIGIRMAIGAPRRHVVWMVVRDSLVVCAAGIVVGLPLAIAGSRFLESMLFGLTPRDPISYGAALAIVVALSIVASIIPARRAVSVDPMIALRSE